jgi:hypothetical protein
MKRAVKAGREAARRGSLEGPVIARQHNGPRSPPGFLTGVLLLGLSPKAWTVRSYLLVAGIGAGAGFRDAAELRRHTEGSGVRHPFAARGRMKLFGTTVAGAIRRLGRRMGP